MSDELHVLKTVTQRLEKAQIPYMLTGSMSANIYTKPRMTRDIDIVIELEKPHVKGLINVFKEDFYIDADSIQEAITRKGMFNIIDNSSLVKIDFIVRKNEPYRKAEFERRRQIKMDGLSLWIVSAEDLIISKLFWAKDSHSEQQLSDVKNILKSVPAIDQVYLKKWILNLNLEKIYELAQSHE